MSQLIERIVEIFREKKYLIICIICVFFWAILSIIAREGIFAYDYQVFHNAGKQIFQDPANLYDITRYYYSPAFALYMALTFSLLPFEIAIILSFILNLILFIIFLGIFDKILLLLKINNRWYRFLFLLVMANGWGVYIQFSHIQTKVLIMTFLALIILREIKTPEESKNIKFYFINYFMFGFILSVTPYFIFFLLIYVFHNIGINEVFKKRNVQKYILIIGIILIQNFLFLIYPNLIYDFVVKGIMSRTDGASNTFPNFYLGEWLILEDMQIAIIRIIFLIILLGFTILLIAKHTPLIESFGYFALLYLIFGTYKSNSISVKFFILLFLAFKFFKADIKNFKEMIRENIWLIQTLLAVALFFLIPEDLSLIFKYLPFLQNYPYLIIVNIRYIIFLVYLYFALFILFYKTSDSRLFSNS